MADEPNTGNPVKIPIGGELVIPIAAISFTIYYFSTIIDSPWTAQVSAFFVGSILIALCTAFLIRSAVWVKREKANLSFETLFTPYDTMVKRALLFVLTVGYIAIVPYGGFTIVTFVFLALGMLLLTDGRNKRLIIPLSAALALGGYFLFIVAFKRRFPYGPFEDFFKPIVASLWGGS